MKNLMNGFLPAPGAFAFALLLVPMRLDDPQKPKVDLKVPLPTMPSDEHDPHVEMARIFGEIEVDLREIDRLLSDASACNTPAAGAAEKAAKAIAGIDELLANSEKRSREVLAGIDKLFELADHEHSAGGT
jgi:hypothetical protein